MFKLRSTLSVRGGSGPLVRPTYVLGWNLKKKKRQKTKDKLIRARKKNYNNESKAKYCEQKTTPPEKNSK